MEYLLLLIAALVVCGEGSPPFQSHRNPAETVLNYEVHTPVVRGAEDHERMDIEISDHLIHLEMNHGLVASGFTHQYYDEDHHGDTMVVEEGHVNCFYQGEVEGHPDWHVAVSTCHGLHGSFGELGNKERYFHVEPLDPMETGLEQPHVIYSVKEYAKRNESCGTTHAHMPNHSLTQVPSPVHLDKERVRRQVNGFYIVEWAMINDFTQYTFYNRNISAVVLRDLEIANYVDALYRTLSVRVVVVHVITWTTGDRITYPANNNPNTLLDNLQDYEPQITPPHDSTMLITGIDIEGNTVGIAFLSTMCSDSSSVGLSQDGGRSLEGVGSTAAHELGHIFSMTHDDSPRACTCNDPSNTCIMAASSGFPSPAEWSSCSRADLTNGFNDNNLNRCLLNEPDVTVGDPVCGNGIRERDEICDCGRPEECTDPCCNATSCVLNEGAACFQGECCTSSCQFRPLGTLCREVASDCDILEYCPGDTSGCPRDVHMQDGQSCNNGLDNCFSGECQIRNDQCRLYFGSDGADPECSTRSNTVGTGAGNCGYANGDFLACATEHAQCGQLQCDEGDYIGGMFTFSVSIFTRRFFRSDGSMVACRSFTSPVTSDFPNPGLVTDGTSCGNGTICRSQQCVAISSLEYVQPCPIGRNNLTCDGKGVCNNLNQCSCRAGRSGATCEAIESVPGGSSNAGTIAGALIGVIILLAIAAGVTVGVVFLVLYLKKRNKSSYLPTVQNGGNKKTTSSSSSAPTSVKVVNSKPSPKAYKPPNVKKAPPQERPLPPKAKPPNVKKTPPQERPPPPKATPPVNRGAPPPKPTPPTNRNPPPRPSPASRAPPPKALQKQWPPPPSPGNAANKKSKPLPLPTKKPVFPPRK